MQTGKQPTPTHTWVIVAAAGIAVVVAGWLMLGQITATTDKTSAQVSAKDTAQDAKYTAEQFLAACASATTPATPPTPLLRRACELAAQVAAKPVPTAPTTAIPFSDAEMRALIADTIRANPSLVPRGLDGKNAVLTEADYWRIADMVQARVVNGKDAAPVDYAGIVANVLKLIPVPRDGVNGTNGTNGKAGADATDAQVKASVDTYCGARDKCTGPMGPMGPAGPTVCPKDYVWKFYDAVPGVSPAYARCEK